MVASHLLRHSGWLGRNFVSVDVGWEVMVPWHNMISLLQLFNWLDFESKHVLCLQVGPRFEMKPYKVIAGTLDQVTTARVEWTVRPYMNTSYKRRFLSEGWSMWRQPAAWDRGQAVGFSDRTMNCEVFARNNLLILSQQIKCTHLYIHLISINNMTMKAKTL